MQWTLWCVYCSSLLYRNSFFFEEQYPPFAGDPTGLCRLYSHRQTYSGRSAGYKEKLCYLFLSVSILATVEWFWHKMSSAWWRTHLDANSTCTGRKCHKIWTCLRRSQLHLHWGPFWRPLPSGNQTASSERPLPEEKNPPSSRVPRLTLYPRNVSVHYVKTAITQMYIYVHTQKHTIHARHHGSKLY